VRFFQSLGVLAALLFLGITPLSPSAAGEQQAGEGARPTARAVRVEGEPPVIDGDLSDPAWARAEVIEGFRQLEPMNGAPTTQRTTVRILYDANNLYMAIYNYDTEPDTIVVRSMTRDGDLWTGDNVSFVLDPGLTRRNGYRFQIGPSGGRRDALILNNDTQVFEWNPIWAVRTGRVPDGWTVELAIPFQSLSYQPGLDWGFDIQREMRAHNERTRWANVNRNTGATDLSQSGTLTGITDVTQGIGLDVQVYGAVHGKRDWHIPGDEIGPAFTGGGNVFYRVTPALTATATFNPDFSDAPLDARQVNTTRFSLFVPETRDFFLQDAGAFLFGGRNFAGGERDVNNGRPFFSRNIGLVGGTPVSIIAGGKLSGEHAGFGIGALTVLTDETPTSDGQVLSVARVTRAFGESRFGAIVTHGDPTGETTNTVAGVDFQFRNSNFGGDDRILVADVYYQRSFSNLVGDDDSFGAVVAYPNETWFGELSAKQIGAKFEPALGFIRRSDIRDYFANVGHRWRFTNFLQTIELATSQQFVTDLDDRLETRESRVDMEVELRSNDQFSLGLINTYENIPEPFDIADSIIVPVGEFNWTALFARFQTAQFRPISLGIEMTCCNFFNGNALETQATINYRPNEFYDFSLQYEFSNFRLSGGDVDVHVFQLSGGVNFTPDMDFALQLQYDTVSDNVGFLGRYRWEYVPGGELFVALGQAGVLEDSHFAARRSQLSVRLGHTFRF
jgi:hypothetical protein